MRRNVHAATTVFFDTSRQAVLQAALAMWARFYEVPVPRVTLVRSIRKDRDGNTILGRCFSDGVIELWLPAAWRKRQLGTRADYCRTLYHELAHYLFFVRDEQKAELYAARFVRGIK